MEARRLELSLVMLTDAMSRMKFQWNEGYNNARLVEIMSKNRPCLHSVNAALVPHSLLLVPPADISVSSYGVIANSVITGAAGTSPD